MRLPVPIRPSAILASRGTAVLFTGLVGVLLVLMARSLAGGASAAHAASSDASAAPTSAPGSVWPWALTADAPTTCRDACTLVLGQPGAAGVTVQAIRLPAARGALSYARGILSGHDLGATHPLPPRIALTAATAPWTAPVETGNLTGPTQQSLRQLFAWDARELCHGGSESCASLYRSSTDAADQAVALGHAVCTTSPRCPRVGIVTRMRESSRDLTPATRQVTITGYACLYLTSYQLAGSDRLTLTGRLIADCPTH
jgi:hypothetical protein